MRRFAPFTLTNKIAGLIVLSRSLDDHSGYSSPVVARLVHLFNVECNKVCDDKAVIFKSKLDAVSSMLGAIELYCAELDITHTELKKTLGYDNWELEKQMDYHAFLKRPIKDLSKYRIGGEATDIRELFPWNNQSI